jgi:glyoxylase-like metal-dependent hydrolase (beta-lactamase superfamily II)
MAKEIQLKPYQGIEASVNAYVFSDSKGMILVDCLRNSEEAKKLADILYNQNKPLSHILITHGHPDHYLGIGVIRQAFPDAKIVVASPEIKKDIAAFSAWMEKVGWMEKEPAMKPKSDLNPNGFDYEKNIHVLASSTLQLPEGAILQLRSDYEASECEHLTTIYSEDLNAFFPGDFCYNKVHPWLAIDRENIAYWKRQLKNFKSEFSLKRPTIYPGHGQPATIALFDELGEYIEDFETTVSSSNSRAEAMLKMRSLYPDHQQADFLLMYSVNAFVAE